jgi:hypothetical protein
MEGQGERMWLPLADWLLVAATLICLLLVIIPLVSAPKAPAIYRLVAAASGSAAILVAGYVLAILAHYRIVFARQWLFWGRRRKGLYGNPEPSERILSIIASALALLYFAWRLFLQAD